MFWNLEDDNSIWRISSSPKWDIHRWLGIYIWSLGKRIKLEGFTTSPVDTSVWEYRDGFLFRELPVFQKRQRASGKECVQRWYHLGAIKTPKKGNRSMYCHQVLPWMKPLLRGEETLKGRSWDPEYYQHVRVEQMKTSLQEDFISVAEDRERKLEECGNVKAKRRDSSGGRQATERWSEIRIETKAKWKRMFSMDSSRCGRSTEESHLNQPARTGRFPEGGGSWDKEWVTRVN